VFTSVKELKDELKRFIKVPNQYLAKPFKWKKSAEKTIASVERKKVLPNKSHEPMAIEFTLKPQRAAILSRFFKSPAWAFEIRS